MSNPALPNLLLSRGGRGGRGFRRGRGRDGASSSPRAPGGDETIQGTDTDAAVSRLSAVESGYLEDDPYARYFVQSSPGPSSRRLPIINRGTYTRTTALDILIGRFEFQDKSAQGTPQERQIISLGAGTDTRPFRLFARPNQQHLVYHELDFPAMTAKKLRIVRAIPALGAILPDASDPGDGSWGARPPSGGEYWCHGVDLRGLIQGDSPATLPGLRNDIPTLLVSECCLCYLEASETKDIVKWFADKIANLGVVLYEPVKPDDPFGRMMVSNLAARRIRMPTLEAFKAPSDQVARLKDAGFGSANAVTVDEIFETWITNKEKERVDGLEGLDEVEEWKLLAGHYVVAWGWKGDGFKLLEGFPDGP